MRNRKSKKEFIKADDGDILLIQNHLCDHKMPENGHKRWAGNCCNVVTDDKIKEIQDYGGILAWIKEVPNCKDCGNPMSFNNSWDNMWECCNYEAHVELGLMKLNIQATV